jgi:hypothetical protein
MAWHAKNGSNLMEQGEGPIRVVQWATGKLGPESLRQIIDHPDLELAGVYVYSKAKAGNDARGLARGAGVDLALTDTLVDRGMADEAARDARETAAGRQYPGGG